MSRGARKFRRHVIALDPGSPIGWPEMDAWAEANCPKSWRLRDPDTFWAGTPWDDLCVTCLCVCEAMEKEGWLVRQKPSPPTWDPDAYLRTARELWD
jgi:hypothetical protein